MHSESFQSSPNGFYEPQETKPLGKQKNNEIGYQVHDIGRWLAAKEDINAFFTQVEALAFELLEQGLDVPGYKLVPKRALRKWTDEGKAKTALLALGLNEPDVTETKLLSPAQAEKVLKKHKLALPEDVVVAVSSGSTIAPESDPRPAVMQIGKQLSAALGKLV